MNKSLLCIAFAVAFTGSSIKGDADNPLESASKNIGNQADSQQPVNIKERLQRANLPAEKLALLKDVASSNEATGKQALLEYFMSLPPSEISTNPYSDLFKVQVFETVLPLLDLKERKKFVESVLADELSNLRAAYCKALGNKYPKSLWNKIVSVIESDESARDLRDRFSSIAKDDLLPLQVRSSALAANMRYDLEKNKDSEIQMIQNVLEHIPLMPEAMIPWEHYNDKNKYIAYCYSEAYKSQRNRIKDWRSAGQEVVFEGNLEFLRTHGLKAVEMIVAMLERTDLPLERRNGLAEVAAKILAWTKVLSTQERELVDGLVGKLEKYIDKMPDTGYFGTRYYAIQGLQKYYSNQGIKQGYPFKDGRTREWSLVTATNNVYSIATNHVPVLSPPAKTITKKLIVFVTLLSLLVFGIVISIIWKLKGRK